MDPTTITMTGNSYTIGAVGANSTISLKSAESVLDSYDMNQLCVEHRITEFELMKLKDADVNYAEHIKTNLSKMASNEVVKRMTFTKKKEVDADTTSFRGRVYVFTKDELLSLIRDAME